jgi:hypothetical protein
MRFCSHRSFRPELNQSMAMKRRTSALCCSFLIGLSLPLSLRAQELNRQDVEAKLDIARKKQADGNEGSIAKAYTDIITKAQTEGAKQIELTARNNLGAQLLADQKYAEALDVFKSMRQDVQWAKASQQPLYHYNIARAFELAGSPKEAYGEYEIAMTQSPGFRLASDGAFRLLLNGPKPDIKTAVKLARVLLASRETDAAAAAIRKALAAWGGEADAAELMGTLVDCWIAASVGPPEFEKSELPTLRELEKQHESLAKLISEIDLAYRGELKLALDERAGRPFSSWSELRAHRSSFSRLLGLIGDFYNNAGNPGQALMRYFSAWRVDESNSDSLLYCAAVLRKNAKELDPAGELRNQLIDVIFSGKGGEYQIPVKSVANWKNILRLHVVLGTIFDQEGKTGDEDEPRSSVFQWSHALAIIDRLGAEASGVPAKAEIQTRLGGAYEKAGRADDAWKAYSDAADLFLRNGDAAKASQTIGKLTAWRAERRPDQQQRLEQLQSQLKKIPAASNGTENVPPHLQQLKLSADQVTKVRQIEAAYAEKDREVQKQKAALETQKAEAINGVLTAAQRAELNKGGPP